jgi:hypothetical protein
MKTAYETHQTLFEGGKGRGGEQEYNGGVNVFNVLSTKPPHIINVG